MRNRSNSGRGVCLGAVLEPAVGLMNRLRYPHKFALISTLFLIPITLMQHGLLTELGTRIDFSQNELRGIAQLLPLRTLLELVPQARALERQADRGDPEAYRQWRGTLDGIDEAMARLEAVQRRQGAALGTTAAFEALKEAWGTVERIGPGGGGERYDVLLDRTMDLVECIGDGSNLVLDPDLDTYYLIDVLLLRIPGNAALLDRIAQRGREELAGQEGADSREALAALLRAERSSLIRNKEVLYRQSSEDLASTLGPSYLAYREAIDRVIDELEGTWGPIGPELAALAEKARAVGFAFWDQGGAELDRLLRARIDRERGRMGMVLAVNFATCGLVVYVWIGFYLAVKRTITALREASRRMVGGDFEGAVPLKTQDELGGVVRSFNAVAGRLRHEWAQAREESARAWAAEAGLRQSEAQVRQIIDAAMDSVAVLDAGGRVREWNPQAEATFGWSRVEALGRSLVDLIVPVSARLQFESVLTSAIRAADSDPSGSRTEWDLIHRDGFQVPIELSLTRLHSGADAMLSAFLRDLTDRRRAEQESRKAEQLRIDHEAAKAANQAKCEFLANMSHEIRTPMNGILGMTELALDTELTPLQRDYLTMVKGSADALLAVINDILDFSKVEAGKYSLDLVPFELRDCIDQMVRPLALRADAKGLELVCRVAPEVPERVLGDPFRLRQILVNLVGNAIKFTDRGEVVVEVVADPEGDRGRLCFRVRDTGIGIPEERIGAIFEPFVQADGSTTKRYGGTGLGLTISARLVNLMGGRLWVKSQVGRGSTFGFTVSLPPCETPVSSRQSGPPVPVDGLRVLIVDDNRTNRLILEELLAGWGMEPRMAEGGAEALELFQASATVDDRPFHLVVLDEVMPDMDGFEVARRLRAIPGGGAPYLLMYTTGGRANDPARWRSIGIDHCLRKPINQADLLEAIQELVQEGPGTPRPGLPAPTSTLSRNRPDRPPARILVAEDNPVNQAYVSELLRRRGDEVVVVGDGREALKAIERERFDLVLMDIQMPELDGFGAVAEIRHREADRADSLQVIALTAFAMKGDRQRCLDAGFDGYLAKPIHADALYRAIDSILIGTPMAPWDSSGESADAPIDGKTPRAGANGSPELTEKLVRLFFEDLPAREAEIDTAIAAGDPVGLARAAHALKGSAANFDAPAVVAEALRLEQIGRFGDLSDAGAVRERLTRALDALRSVLEARPPFISSEPPLSRTTASGPREGSWIS